MTDKALVIKNINHSYKETRTISNFTLSVSKGEIVSIIGPSGCGKTTLLRLISGFENPKTGQIKIGNRIVFGDKFINTENRGVGMLFQDIALFPHMTVEKNVGFSIQGNKEVKKKIISLLKKVNLEKLINRYPDTLSGGEQQRVALARALAKEPDIMLLDEPFASLDSWSKYDIGESLINILKLTNTATLIVTHDPQEAMKLSDRVLVMINGEIVDEGTPEYLYGNAKHPFAVRLLGPTMDFKNEQKDLIFRGLFNVNFNSTNIKYDNMELLVRPDAFTVTLIKNKGFDLEILKYRKLGSLTELVIKVKKVSISLKILIYSNILPDVIKHKRLLFNKEWAFVFPKS